ncbi:alpha/beta hydrolase [Foetidibacter luteolus]|uniref:alpha/beta hydrolase n=1 Tax=Foetidibacter luteolus TaxID=2608880 RepID=UPI001A9996C4|nr:alpha/beta fold hydrolase [Foetidibacter luteolus]
MKYSYAFGAIAICFSWLTGFSQTNGAYIDTAHYSKVFGHPKYYRLYLPEGYGRAGKRYPVIYFFHGWGGRHFKDDNALLEYEKIKTLADKYQVLLVMWDGNIDTAEPRPYNTGNHEDIKFSVQMKDYFPELISHIDSAYLTLTDRQHRGIIGFSMGGFMSFFLAGKYPEKISAAVSLAGSPEFFIGYPQNHTLYPLRYTFKNLQDVNIRMHNGDSDILYYLNDEVKQGAKWEGIPVDYWKFHGGHMVDIAGETKVFETAMRFITETFNNPAPRKPRWSHYDLYPAFSAWDYQVNTSKSVPGFVLLKNVDKNGCGLYSYQWLPDGPSIPLDTITVLTAPLYQPGKTYRILTCNTHMGTTVTNTQKADETGRLSFRYTQTSIETGIYDDNDSPNLVVMGYRVDKGSRYLRQGKPAKLSIQLLNRVSDISPFTIRVAISASDSAVQLIKTATTITVPPNTRLIAFPPVTIVPAIKAPAHGEPPQVKLNITMQTGKTIYTDDITIPVLYNAPMLDSIQTDDGLKIRDKPMGTGNGNGIAEAGETLLLYSGAHRLRLYTEDKWVIKETLADEMIPARWPDGFTVNSLISISPDCPDGHVIELHASYETKTFNPIERKTTWGRLRLTIQNKSKPGK